MATLITGSFAYDTIMVFRDQFKKHILPDQIHILNVCFDVPEMRREFGGCSGNISYNLHLLGDNPIPMGTVGQDFLPYRQRLKKLGINCQHIQEINGTYTAQAFVTTDTDNNQIIAFHSGAMTHAHKNQVRDASDIDLGIIAPDGRDAMIQHAEQFVDMGIPFFFDPGQGLSMFNTQDLERFINQSTYIVLNDYELKMMLQKLERNMKQIVKQVDALIVTQGSKGATIFYDSSNIHIDAIQIEEAKDPTGCGDAFRAGLLYGVSHHWDWNSTGALASLMGGIKIESSGPQNHSLTRNEICKRFKKNFGYSISL